MKVLDLAVNSFWKEELGVKAVVEAEENRYRVQLSIKGSQIRDYSCSCARGISYKGMCEHEKLVWETWKTEADKKSRKQVSTSQEVRAMIREYTNREVEKILREGEGEPVRLVPRLVIRRQEICLECKIGRGRSYLIKDFLPFALAVERGAPAEYGKNLSFYHSLESFHPDDRKLVKFVVEQTAGYREHWEQFQKRAFAAPAPLKELVLGQAARDRFLSLMEGRELEVDDTKGSTKKLRVTGQTELLSVTAERAGRDGIRVSLEEGLSGFFGESHLYLVRGERLVRLDRDASEGLRVFFEQMMGSWGSKKTAEIQEKDIPLFLERVLLRIRPYCNLEVRDVDLELYRPLELKAEFSFDSKRPGELTMRPVLSYGDFSFHPVEDDKVPRTVCRDVPGEFRISQLITKYFQFREGQTRDLIIRDDDDAMYRLLKDGIPEFMKLGEVYVSEEAAKMKLLAPPKISLGVSVSGSWLDLKVDTEGITHAELIRILAQYQQKKPYYRMKSGEFLQLDDQGLVTVARLVDGLAISKTQLLENQIRIPAYRTLYLDSLLKEQSGISTYRDPWYKSIVRGMKAVEDSEFEIPPSLGTVLRGYQKTGFRWLKTLDRYGFGGILADDMGLGKTIQVIALLLDEKERGTGSAQSLIVCPASLVYNWENEILKFAPQLTVLTVTGQAVKRQEQLRAQEHCDVVITSYDLLKRDMSWYEGKQFRFQILDEAQYMKNPKTQCARSVKMIEAQSRFALTGTPIENRLGELWSIFDYLMPGFLLSYQRFKSSFETPIARDGNAQALDSLRVQTGPFILRRTKKEVLRELPDKLESVLYSQMEKEQNELYTAHAVTLKRQLEQLEGRMDGQQSLAVLAELTRLRQLCCDPSLCYAGYKGGSAKLEACLDLVESGVEGGHKILLFSQFTSMLERIGKQLAKKEISFRSLTGSTTKEERIRLVEAFQRDPSISVFLISLKAGGTGLNLTAADMVVHYDPWWNVAAQNQATDRAHRIGQDKQVQVWKLIAKDTIEENIMKLQESKQDLADQIVSGKAGNFGSLGREDLIRLLEQRGELHGTV